MFFLLFAINSIVLIASNFNFLTAAPNTPIPDKTKTSFQSLPPDFDGSFRFLNQFNLVGKIAFTASIDGFDRILTLNLEQKRIEKIIDGPGNNFYPAWSPDGSKIAFVSDRDGNNEIYTADSSGGNLKRITNNNVDNDHPSWTPDGSQIFYFQQTGGKSKNPQGNIFSYSIAENNSKQITKYNYKNSTPKLSADGITLAYSTNRFWPGWDICFLNLRNLSEECPLSGTTTFCRPAWSNDGKSLAYSTGLFSNIDGAILDVTSRKDLASWATSGNDYDLEWSPDDKFIVFGSDTEKSELFNLYIYPLENNNQAKSYPLLRSPYSLRFLSWHGSQKPVSSPSPLVVDGEG